MSLSDLSLCVDHDDFVTSKLFALTYNTSIAEATELMTKYADTNKDIGAKYLLSTQMKGDPSHTSFIVVDEKDIANIEKDNVILNKSVYALLKRPCSEFSTVAAITHEDKCSEMLLLVPNYDHYLHNKLGGISLLNLEVKPRGERAVVAVVRRDATPEEDKLKQMLAKQKTKVLEAKAVSFFEKGDAKEKSLSKENKTNSAAPTAASTKVSKKDKGFFNTSEKATKEVVKEVISESVDTTTDTHEIAPVIASKEDASSDSAAAAVSINLEQYIVNSDEEWEDGYKPDKKNLDRMGKAFGAPDGEGGMHQPEIDDSIQNDVEEKAEKIHVRGAIDDFVSDHVDNEMSGTMIKKRRLVSKVHEDEKGYLVTSMEYEEYEEEVVVKPSKLQKTEVMKTGDDDDKKKDKEKKKSKAADTKPSTQKSMMSFFGAKKA